MWPGQHHPQEHPISGTSLLQVCSSSCRAAVSQVGASQSTQQFEGGYPGGAFWVDLCVMITWVQIFSRSTHAFSIVTSPLYLPSPQYFITILFARAHSPICPPNPCIASTAAYIHHHCSYWHRHLNHNFVMRFHLLDASDELVWALAFTICVWGGI